MDSSILIGNLNAPVIDLQGVVYQNWTDLELKIEKGEKILTLEFDQEDKTVLCGNPKTEGEMIRLFQNYEVKKETVEVQNFMRTILSALNCTAANVHSNFKTLEDKQLHISKLLGKANIGINALGVTKTGDPKLDYLRNRRALNRVLLSQLLQKQVGLTISDLVKIQSSCPYLLKMRDKSLQLKTDKFKVNEGVLY